MKNNISDSAKVYNPVTLKIYDWWVLSVSNRFAWRCETSKHLLPHYMQHVRQKHLDIGVGTGFYLPVIPKGYSISLLDLNEASLNAASRRVGSQRITKKFNMMFFNLFQMCCINSMIPYPCFICCIAYQA